MRRIRIAWSILLVLVLCAVCTHIAVHTAVEYTMEELDMVSTLADAGDFEKAAAAIDAMNENFDRRAHLFEFFIKRETVSGVAVNLHGLAAYADEETALDLSSEVAKAREQVHMMEHLFSSIF